MSLRSLWPDPKAYLADYPSLKKCLFVVAFTIIIYVVAGALHDSVTPNSSAALNASPALPQWNATDLPTSFEHWTGDLDGMVKRQKIRALVVYSKSAFFFDNGRPEGISFEALQEFQHVLNRELKTDNFPVTVTFLPVGYGQLEKALTDGIGDLIAVPVGITSKRRQRVAFSAPVMSHAKQIVVTGPTSPTISSLDDLSGKQVFVNPMTVYSQSLKDLNKSLAGKGKKSVLVKPADTNLSDEDLIEMVNAGIIPATVTLNLRAVFWAKVYDKLRLCSACVLSDDEQLAWVMRKDSPKFNRLVDEFVATHREGTSFGNTLLRRYLQNTNWVKNATADSEMKKFQLYVDFFKKYAAEYDFDYLMLVALSYQESGLNQDRRNPTGAVGIMQVIPKYAAASPIDIPNVDTAEPNIHAGTKMLRVIADTYFKDDNLDPLNKTLLTFASYNAGPTRIADLRKKASREGLSPNIWFGNVELVVAKEIGQQTVRYVSNIYKYYVAYKLTLEQAKLQKEAEIYQ